MFTLCEAGTWLLKHQTTAGALSLHAIDLGMTFGQVFRGVAGEAAA